MASFKFNNVYLSDYYTLICNSGNFFNKNLKFNEIIDDYYYGSKTIEQAEIKMQNTVLTNIIKRNIVENTNIDLVIGGDLSNQIVTTNYNMQNFKIPHLGVYSACATFVESLIIMSNFIDSDKIKNGITITSSHNLNSEKQFRFPIEYGAYKPNRCTITATGCAAAFLSKKGNIKVESATIGKVINSNIKDVFDMGGVMSISASDTIYNHLKEMNRKIDYYDLILTGDLGLSGQEILKDVMYETYKIKLKKYQDAGCNLFNMELEETKNGASGPVVLPLYLFSKVLNNKRYKKILIVGTGSLHSPVLVNQKKSIPSISHAVSLEALK